MHEDDRDLPEGVINANPAGGWQDGRAADAETEDTSDDDAYQSSLEGDGWVADIPQAENAARSVESDVPTQGADPDLATDEDAAGGAGTIEES